MRLRLKYVCFALNVSFDVVFYAKLGLNTLSVDVFFVSWFHSMCTTQAPTLSVSTSPHIRSSVSTHLQNFSSVPNTPHIQPVIHFQLVKCLVNNTFLKKPSVFQLVVSLKTHHTEPKLFRAGPPFFSCANKYSMHTCFKTSSVGTENICKIGSEGRLWTMFYFCPSREASPS